MKKGFLLFVFCISNLIFSSPIKEHIIDPEALSELALAFGISADKNIIEETQKHWLRKPNQERWELFELDLDRHFFVLNWAKEQGFFDSWKPSCMFYDKALIFGATTLQMKIRLSYLKKLWFEGIRFNEIVWLTGDRPLDERVDSLVKRCNNESEAAHIIWEEADIPEDMRNLPVVFIAVPMKSEGLYYKRPNTKDTIIAWLKAFPEACKVLFISNQPFCGYQFTVTKKTLPEDFLFDVVGSGIDFLSHSLMASVVLDTVARWMYEENLIIDEKISYL